MLVDGFYIIHPTNSPDDHTKMTKLSIQSSVNGQNKVIELGEKVKVDYGDKEYEISSGLLEII